MLTDNGLLKKASAICNMDMPLDHEQLKHVTKQGAKKMYGRAAGNKTQITIVACANAIVAKLRIEYSGTKKISVRKARAKFFDHAP